MAISAPTDIANCTCWLDASQETFANGDPVETWTDRTGLGRHFTRTAGGSTRPTFVTGWSSTGKPGIDFDGTDDYLELNAATDTLIDTTDWTVGVFFEANTIGSDDAFNPYANDAIVSGDTGNFGLHLRSTGATLQGYGWDTNADFATKTISTGTEYVAQFRYDGSSIYLSVNGGTESSVAHGTNASLGADTYIGVNFTTVYADITVGEIAFYDRALSGSEVADLNTYLYLKWIYGQRTAWLVA